MKRSHEFDIQGRSSGFSLIEILIVCAMLGILAVAGASLIVHQASSLAYMEDRLSKTDLEKEISTLLGNRDACEKSLAGTAILTGLHDITLRNRDGQPEFSATGETAVYDRLSIEKIQARDKSIGAPNQSGTIEILISTSRVRTGGGPAKLSQIVIPVEATTDGAGRILTCGRVNGVNDLCTCNGPGVNCDCCAPGKVWTLVGSWDQEDLHGVHRPCLECPSKGNTSDWMVHLCAGSN